MSSDDARVWEPRTLTFALGLCAKARRLTCGVPMICDSLGSPKKPVIVVCAADNAKNSAKKLADKCAFYGVRLVTVPLSGAELAHAIGKTGHIAAVAVTDEQMAVLVQKNLPEQ